MVSLFVTLPLRGSLFAFGCLLVLSDIFFIGLLGLVGYVLPVSSGLFDGLVDPLLLKSPILLVMIARELGGIIQVQVFKLEIPINFRVPT